MSLRDDLFSSLSREPQTISQLAKRFGVTRNAVVVQLHQLESSGMIARGEAERQGRVGKPAILYEAKAGNEDRASSAYRLFCEMLVKRMAKEISLKKRKAFFRKMGKDSGHAICSPDLAKLEDRLAAVQSFADSLGAATTLEEKSGKYVMRSYTCPIASVARIEPCACRTLAAVFEEMTGRPTRERCKRNGKLICQFEIEK